jgi:hypothetical protein
MVKIGCAYNPYHRMTHMQTCCPVELVVEALLPGAYAEERRHHALFAEHRVRGEWFKITPEIEALIASNPAPNSTRSIAQRRRILAMHEVEPPKNRALSKQEQKYADAMAAMRAKEDA